MRYEQNLIWY